MNYKVGDKVKIRTDLEVGKCYGKYEGYSTINFTREMIDFLGKTVEITYVYEKSDGQYYQCYSDELDDFWFFSEEMFDTTSTPSKSPLVYISGAITGVPNYANLFKYWQEKFDSYGIRCINPASLNDSIPALDYEEYMKIDLTYLSMCDIIFMLNGWQNSKGAQRELKYAIENGITILLESDCPYGIIPLADFLLLTEGSERKYNYQYEYDTFDDLDDAFEPLHLDTAQKVVCGENKNIKTSFEYMYVVDVYKEDDGSRLVTLKDYY